MRRIVFCSLPSKHTPRASVLPFGEGAIQEMCGGWVLFCFIVSKSTRPGPSGSLLATTRTPSLSSEVTFRNHNPDAHSGSSAKRGVLCLATDFRNALICGQEA